MSQSEVVERIIARHCEDAAVAVIVAWAKSEQDRLMLDDELAQVREINARLPFADPIVLVDDEGEDG